MRHTTSYLQKFLVLRLGLCLLDIVRRHIDRGGRAGRRGGRRRVQRGGERRCRLRRRRQAR